MAHRGRRRQDARGVGQAVAGQREREVLELMASGLTNSGIAAKLVVTEKAVERHVTSIFSKLLNDSAPNEHRRVLAVLRFLQSAV